MSYSVNDFKRDIEEILSICEEDLQAISKGKKREATKEQIEGTIIPEMNNLLELIRKGELPPKGRRWILSTAYITRGWNWDISRNGACSREKLPKKLAYINDKYSYELDE